MWTSFALVLLWTSEVKWKLLSCPTLCDPTDYTGHGILEARILEWVAFPFSKGSFQPETEPRSPALQADSSPAEPQGKPKNTGVGILSLLQRIVPTQEWNQGLLHCRRDSLPTELSGKHEPVINSLQTSIGPQITLWGALVHTNFKKKHTHICHN